MKMAVWHGDLRKKKPSGGRKEPTEERESLNKVRFQQKLCRAKRNQNLPEEEAEK